MGSGLRPLSLDHEVEALARIPRPQRYRYLLRAGKGVGLLGEVVLQRGEAVFTHQEVHELLGIRLGRIQLEGILTLLCQTGIIAVAVPVAALHSLLHLVLVDEGPEVLIVQGLDALHLVRGAEAVKAVHKAYLPLMADRWAPRSMASWGQEDISMA